MGKKYEQNRTIKMIQLTLFFFFFFFQDWRPKQNAYNLGKGKTREGKAGAEIARHRWYHQL